MKKVKYISDYSCYGLTAGEIYDVISIRYYNGSILLKNDIGKEIWYITIGNISGLPLFEDVTIKFRNETISEILDYD